MNYSPWAIAMAEIVFQVYIKLYTVYKILRIIT